MNQSPTLHLFVPELLRPLSLWQQDFRFVPKSNVFAKLLSQSVRKKALQEQDIYTALFSTNPEDISVAASRHTLDFQQQANLPIICADPVHLVAGTDALILSPYLINDISVAELEALLNLLNQHFAEDGLIFSGTKQGHWYLQAKNLQIPPTYSLMQVMGENIFPFLVQSQVTEAGLNWSQLQNEISMLLYTAEVNQQREAVGKLPISSLWFWNIESFDESLPRATEIFSDTIAGKVFASATKIKHLSLPKSIKNHVFTEGQFFIFDQLFLPARQEQITTWQQQLAIIETTWLQDLFYLYQKKKIQLCLHTCDGYTYHPKTKAWWQFWHAKTPALSTFSSTHFLQ